MPVVAFFATLAYAAINAFGAWLVSRRKPWVAALFMLAAVVLVVSAAAFISRIPDTRLMLALGVLLASAASFVNARIVIGKVVWRNHLIRAFAGLLIYLLGELARRYPL